MQRPSSRSYWKIPLLNKDLAIARCVNEKKTLTASLSYEALIHADVVVVDVQCDYSKAALADITQGTVEMAALEASLKEIAQRIPPSGTTEYVAYPIMKKAPVPRHRRIALVGPQLRTGHARQGLREKHP